MVPPSAILETPPAVPRCAPQAYERSLPDDPIAALSEINRALVETRDAGSPHYAPHAAIEIIRELSIKGSLDGSQQMSDAVFWLTTQALDGLTSIDSSILKSRDIAHKFHPTHQPYEA